MDHDRSHEKFGAILGKLNGLACWSYVAGPGTGSVVALDFGQKIQRSRPLRNPSLTHEQRHFEGEISIIVECAWRIDSPIRVLGGSADDNRQGGPMLNALDKLIGSRVEGVRALAPGYDLLVVFEEDLRLGVFAVETNLDENIDNYSIFTGESVLTVGAGSRLREESR